MTDIFIHIHKSGGTTLKEVLDRCYADAQVYEIDGRRYRDSYRELLALLRSNPKKYFDLVKGHQLYGLHEHLNGESRYFAMLREPISRVVSLYNFLRQIDLYPQINEQQMDLIDFAKSRLAFAADNGMVRFIAGVDLETCPYGHLEQNHLDTAIEHIVDNFCFVGLSEQFDLSLLALQSALQWPRKPLYVPQNVTTGHFRKYEPSEEEVTFLNEFLRFDIALYKHVNNGFKAEVRRILGPTADKQLAQFKKELAGFQNRNESARPSFWQRIFNKA